MKTDIKTGLRIREYRTRAHLTQEALAEQLGVSRQAVAKWEGGQSVPSMENLLRLCELLGVSLEALAGDEQKTPPTAPPRLLERRGTRVLLAVGSLLLILGSVLGFVAWREAALPENCIGYADAPTEIYLQGEPVLLYLLWGAAALWTAFTAGVFIRSARRKRRGSR